MLREWLLHHRYFLFLPPSEGRNPRGSAAQTQSFGSWKGFQGHLTQSPTQAAPAPCYPQKTMLQPPLESLQWHQPRGLGMRRGLHSEVLRPEFKCGILGWSPGILAQFLTSLFLEWINTTRTHGDSVTECLNLTQLLVFSTCEHQSTSFSSVLIHFSIIPCNMPQSWTISCNLNV